MVSFILAQSQQLDHRPDSSLFGSSARRSDRRAGPRTLFPRHHPACWIDTLGCYSPRKLEGGLVECSDRLSKSPTKADRDDGNTGIGFDRVQASLVFGQ